MKYWIIQAERQNTAEARDELEKTRLELDEAKKKADEALKNGIRTAIEIYRELGFPREGC